MKKQLMIASVIVISSLILHYLTAPMFFGLSVSLVLIGFIAIIRFLAFFPAVITTAILTILLYFADVQVNFLLFAFCLTVIIAWLYQRERKDLCTWTFVTSFSIGLVYFLLFYIVTGIDSTNILALFSYLQHSIIFIIIALLFDFVTFYFPYNPVFKKRTSYQKPVLFGKLIFNVIVTVAVIPLLAITLLNTVLGHRDLVNHYQDQAERFQFSITEYIEQLDEQERQRFLLGSTIELGYFNQRLDQFVSNTNNSVYVFNDDQSLFLNSVGAPEFYLLDQKLQRGEWMPIVDEEWLWIDQEGATAKNWYDGYFISSMPLLDKELMLFMPLDTEFLAYIMELTLYFTVIMIVFLLAFLFGQVADWILTNQLNQLNQLATALPTMMITDEKIKIPQSRIVEFSQLSNHIGVAGDRLQKMYLELEEKTDELEESQQKLYNVAHSDNLTSLPNRRSFYRDVEDLIMTDIEYFSILFIDFDQFKLVNDTYGHSGGDRLLVDIANRFRKFNRHWPRATFYRLAGDEFIVVIKETDQDEVEQFGNQLIEKMLEPFHLETDQIYISASIGVSFYPDHGYTLDELLNAADQAMYDLKKQNSSGLNFAPKRGDA